MAILPCSALSGAVEKGGKPREPPQEGWETTTPVPAPESFVDIICCPHWGQGQGQSSRALLGTYRAGTVCDNDKYEYFNLKECADCIVREKRRALKSALL